MVVVSQSGGSKCDGDGKCVYLFFEHRYVINTRKKSASFSF